MCLMVLNWRPEAAVPLLVVANRDEFRGRPTEPMHWWPAEAQRPTLLAGRDQQAGGTWLAIGEGGDFALLTNIRPGYIGRNAERSRGELPLRFIDTLAAGGTLDDFHHDVQTEITGYGGFNLVVGNRQRLLWFSSDHPAGHWLTPGIHAVSNDALDTPWPKTQAAIAQMTAQTDILERDFNAARVLTDQTPANDSALPSTGVPLDIERQLSAQTITGERYGTRCRTWLRVHQDDQINVQETQLNAAGEATASRQFDWQAG
ncbi:NRDE family protein [Saccharospirillum mangrovi]|uniref:NRDE family protein n=1 Tax=Saccharospirillum mangrovi TaxID=2161747 RepID=UPI000D3366AA|nr:NRDE family protein [Saccharospirillum mangrovi]